MDAWQRMCDELGEEDLVLPVADVALTSGIRRKRPDAWAVHWGRRVLYILEFTRPNDWADDWQTRTDAYKTERYSLSLPPSRSLPPTLAEGKGIRTFAEQPGAEFGSVL